MKTAIRSRYHINNDSVVERPSGRTWREVSGNRNKTKKAANQPNQFNQLRNS